MTNVSESSSAWSVIWQGIFDFLGAVKDFMDSVIIFSIGSAFHASLWDFCLAVIIFGAIIGQFIIFAQPALPDKPTSAWREDKANKRYRRSVTSSKRENYNRKK